jgi:hypothetical protein
MKNFIEDSADSIMLKSMTNVFVTEKLDPVGQEDADIDNDGDSDSSDSYLRKRRKAVGAAIAADKAKRVKKEEIELHLRQKVEGLNEKKLYKSEKATTSDEKETEISEKSVKNKIIINPDIAEGVGDKLKSAAKAVKKGIEQEKKFQRASGETLDRMKRMTRHKQDKYGPSTLKQRLKTGADHNIDNEKKAKQVKEGATEVAMSNKETVLQKKKNKIDMMISRERNKELMKKEHVSFAELLERTRYAKETGKDFTTGNESKKGGTRDGKSAFDKVSKEMRKTGGMMSSRKKPIQPQGKKKEKGKKGYKGVTPVDKIKGKLAKKRAPKPSIGSRFD